MSPLHIIKIGGAIISDDIKLADCLDGLAKISEPWLLVHGGGRKADEWLRRINHPIQMVDGRRITDDVTLEIAIMAYAGWSNKQIVSGLQARNINCLGLTGADADIIRAEKRNPTPVDFGWVGDIVQINTEPLSNFVDIGWVPVCCAITHDGKGQLLNTNADTIASAIAANLAKSYQVQLWYAFEKKGVLEDVSDEDSVIPHISKGSYEQLLRRNKIHDGMKPKLSNTFSALSQGVKSVHIFSSAYLGNIPNASGTKITLT